MLHAVIMAGGSGTRFWPASRAALPKQLLDLAEGQTMIQATVNRLGTTIPPERVLVVTNERLAGAVREQLPQLGTSAVVGEPCRRDTAPCIGLAAFWVTRNDPDATMVVMPADHVIRATSEFQQAIQYAAHLVEDRPGRLVTFGIPPTYAAVSFGYIEQGTQLAITALGRTCPPTYQVAKFREKPTADVAEQYVASGKFYWNAGIFVWKAQTILDQLKQHEPAMYEHLAKIAATFETPDFDATFVREFTAIKGRSIDYAVMEKAEEVVVVRAPFDWDDMGSWQAVARQRGVDDQGNTIAAQHIGIDTHGTIVRGPDGHLIATIGLNDCIVVHTPNATLVARKDLEESIREVVKQIEERGWSDFL